MNVGIWAVVVLAAAALLRFCIWLVFVSRARRKGPAYFRDVVGAGASMPRDSWIEKVLELVKHWKAHGL